MPSGGVLKNLIVSAAAINPGVATGIQVHIQVWVNATAFHTERPAGHVL
jgi:hypothetical protein